MVFSNNSLSAIIQLLITIRFYATGAYLRAIGDIYGADVATISRIVKKVTTALSKLRAKYIMFPESESEQIKNQAEFYKIGGFPYVLGAIDCTHIKIQSPGGNDPELFRNRKGYFSLNVQTVSDANLKIISIVTRWAGSTHDSSIFTNSRLCAKFESGQYGSGILLGDSGYGLKNYLLTPYLNPRTRAQEAYNRSHILTRNTVERQYGLLKRRFPILALGLRLALESSINVVISCKAKKRLNFKIYKREFQALL